MTYENIVYVGDFNLHVNNIMETDSQQFLDMAQALGLLQHVKFETHRLGNTLDLILTECVSSVKVGNVKYGPYISDHKLIFAKLNFGLDREIQMERKCRKLREMSIKFFSKI